MSTVVREFFRITHDGDHIAFGPRDIGDKGKDILAVKSALGVISSPSNITSTTEDGSIGEDGWFDCESGMQISPLEGATFDSKTQLALSRFQIENQYYIISYLFDKYVTKN